MAEICVGGDTFIFDDDDRALVESRSWRVLRAAPGYHYLAAGKGDVLLHRLIAGAGKGECVDHIDGDTLNNRRANLRVCSHAENMRNRRKSSSSRSAYKGVSRQSGMDAWVARIGGYKTGRTYLGTFREERDAALAYDAAAIKLYGDFARLNFPHLASSHRKTVAG